MIMRRRKMLSRSLIAVLLSAFLAIMLTACQSGSSNSDDDPSVVEPDGKGETVSGGPGIGVAPGSQFTVEQTDQADIELEYIRACLEGSPNICAVAMLGYADGDLNDFLLDVVRDYPAVAGVSPECWVEAEGDEVYLIVPRDGDASVAVNEWTVSSDSSAGPYDGEMGDVLYRSEYGDPIIVRGNISDIYPNMMVNIVSNEGDSLSYIPFCNLLDGTLDVPTGDPGVLDCTMNPLRLVSPADVAGDWATWDAYDEDGNLLDCGLYIGEDGSLSFAWGPLREPYQNYYEGTWSASPKAGQGDVPEEAVVFDLTLTESVEGAPTEIIGTFLLGRFSDMPHYLYVEHLDGTPLTYAQEANGLIGFCITVG